MKRLPIVLSSIALGFAVQAHADQPELVASNIDPSQIEIVAVKPRNADSKPVIVSLPAKGSNETQAAPPAAKASSDGDKAANTGF